MPTYDYRCNACGHEFELFQKMSDPIKRTCPECKKKQLERLIGTGAAVLFKGSGFYETDYRSDSYKKGADAEKKATETKPSDAKPDKKDSKKAESKPAKKSDSSSAKAT
ncbi:MAG: zinc ribbon domain-containing protein [Phycisphaerales bacterium]